MFPVVVDMKSKVAITLTGVKRLTPQPFWIKKKQKNIVLSSTYGNLSCQGCMRLLRDFILIACTYKLLYYTSFAWNNQYYWSVSGCFSATETMNLAWLNVHSNSCILHRQQCALIVLSTHCDSFSWNKYQFKAPAHFYDTVFKFFLFLSCLTFIHLLCPLCDLMGIICTSKQN